jgi:hypothetical protein
MPTLLLLLLHRVQLEARAEPAESKDAYAQVQVSFICRRLNQPVNETQLKEIFQKFGAIHDVTVKRWNISPVSGF